MCDLLWADPDREDNEGWGYNEELLCSFQTIKSISKTISENSTNNQNSISDSDIKTVSESISKSIDSTQVSVEV